MTMVVCIWFPQWSLQHVLWKRPEFSLRAPETEVTSPLATSQRFPANRPGGNGQLVILHSPATGRGARVVACSSAAWRRGVRVGMPLTEARALVNKGVRTLFRARSRALEPTVLARPKKSPDPFILFILHDPVADRAGLRELAGCCEEYAPIYGVEEAESPECLLLDVTGCAMLFGGEQTLAERIQDDFQERGWQVRVAVAPTIGAAWAVAHGVSCPNQAVVVPVAGLEETLDVLPVHVLRLPDATVQTLSELGIHGVGQLRQLPRDRLPSRFGPLILRRLDQAFGEAPELIVAERPAKPIVATWAAQEPFRDRLVLLEVCRRLLERMLAPLQAKRRGVRRLLCQLHGCGGRPCELSVGMLSPSNSAAQVRELLALQLERVTWEDEITFVRLEALEVGPLDEQPRDLFGDQFGEDHTRELRWLLERLSNRLGIDAVVRAACVPDAQPELAVAYQPWVASEKLADCKAASTSAPSAPRPLRLFAPPQRIEVFFMLAEPPGAPCRFCWEYADHHVRQAWGPERIETGWWRGNPIRRDYYRVEVTSGERYWLFHAAEGWFVHGVFE